MIRESIIHNSELYGELFENLFSYDISNKIGNAHNVNLKLKVTLDSVKLSIKTTDDQNYFFEMTPQFDKIFKKLTLKTTLTIYDEAFKTLKTEHFNLS